MRVTFHKSNGNEWLWTVQSTGNWKIIGASSESYKNRGDAVTNFQELTGRSLNTLLVENKTMAVNLNLDYDPEPWEVIYQ